VSRRYKIHIEVAQETATDNSASANSPLDSSTLLPEEWHGQWRGEVTSFNGTGEAARFQMELEVKPTEDPEKFVWKVTYDGAAGRSERPYQLNVVDAKMGHYEIDEQNGIVLDATRLGDALCFHFATGGQRLWGSYRLDSKSQHIVFELLSGPERTERRTGGGEAPEVRSLRPNNRQVAVLRRVSDEVPGRSGESAMQNKR
jgi:hypothetical protein